ncbi:MAG: hypothetical protein AB1585_20300 [Thermodesulfobacteriota bacterium]
MRIEMILLLLFFWPVSSAKTDNSEKESAKEIGQGVKELGKEIIESP